MANKSAVVETNERGPMGETYRKSSDGLETNAHAVSSLEMNGERRIEDDDVDPEVLEHALESLEGKKKAWYSYLLTKDFWVVLLIGYGKLNYKLLHLG